MKIDAVIHIGSTQFRLVIAQFNNLNEYKVLDRSEMAVNLGKDVFTSGEISSKTIDKSVNILKNFKEQLEGWQIPIKNVKVFGTSALREGKNRDTFIDRVEVRTGFIIKVISGVEEIRLSYLATQYSLSNIQKELSKSNSIIVEVGGGSTEVILLKEGNIVTIHSLSLGAVKLEQQFIDSNENKVNKITEFISHNLNPLLERLDLDMTLSSINSLIAIGNYANQSVQNIKPNNNRFIKVEKNNYLNSFENLLPDEISGNGFYAALVIIKQITKSTNAHNVLIPKISVDEGIFMEDIGIEENTIHEKYAKQVIASAETLGNKYNYDIKHAKHVTKLSLQLFDQLQDEHGLSKHHRMLLEVASILHDVGSFIKTSGHHKHGMYIVENSEIFGLSETELKIVANLVRYHRKGAPQKSHSNFGSLSRENRITILKLASILRISDSLDRGHIQKIQSIKILKEFNKIIILGDYIGDISVERFSLRNKASMFKDVYGLTVEIR